MQQLNYHCTEVMPPSYLIDRMIKLSGAIAKVIVNEYGGHEFLRRIEVSIVYFLN